MLEVFFYSPAKLDEAAAIAATTAQLQLPRKQPPKATG